MAHAGESNRFDRPPRRKGRFWWRLWSTVVDFVRPKGWRNFVVGLFFAAGGIASVIKAMVATSELGKGELLGSLVAAILGSAYTIACARAYLRGERGE